jgi:hypothetical protein
MGISSPLGFRPMSPRKHWRAFAGTSCPRGAVPLCRSAPRPQ